MIMLISINTFYSIIFFEIVFLKKIKDFSIDRDLRKTYEDTSSDLLNLNLIKPSMLSNISDFESFFWICIKNVLDQIFAFR